MLWEMLAYSLHYSAKRRTDHDTEGGNELNSSPLSRYFGSSPGGVSFLQAGGLAWAHCWLLFSLRFLKEVQVTCGRHRVSSLILLDFCIPDKHVVGV